jgi:hypothetical protein
MTTRSALRSACHVLAATPARLAHPAVLRAQVSASLFSVRHSPRHTVRNHPGPACKALIPKARKAAQFD